MSAFRLRTMSGVVCRGLPIRTSLSIISTSLVYRRSCSFSILSCICYYVPCVVNSVLHQHLLSTCDLVQSTEGLEARDRATKDKGCSFISKIFGMHIAVLTVDVALALIRLCDKQVCHVPTNAILIGHCVSTKNFLEPITRVRCAPVRGSAILTSVNSSVHDRSSAS